MKTLALLLAALVLSAVAFPDGGNEHHFRVPPASSLAIPAKPDRALVWGDVNILHTTDVHGWLLGHQKLSPPEPNYSGTLGDFASFVKLMNTTAEGHDRDLLLVDTGDLREGTGLSDGHPDGQWAGEQTDEFFLRLPYDVMTIGNHELYEPPKSANVPQGAFAHYMHTNFSKRTKRYLTSNAFIHITGDYGVNNTVPIGWQFAKFQTRKKLNVTAFGVTFNATSISANVSVQPAEIMVKQQWFQDAIREPPSFFLLTGHMSVGAKFDDWMAVVKPIRDLHKNVPIIILGGHTHKRDCTQFGDDKVVALESGSYMDTVGWLSFNLSSTGTNKALNYSRRYLDPNRVTYMYHTHTDTDEKFDSPEGKKITEDLKTLSQNLNLSHVWGKSPYDYGYYHKTASNHTVLNLFVEEALPTLLDKVPCNGSSERKKFYLINSGVIRYDIYAGDFDQNDQLTAAPYADQIWCISNVSLADATKAAESMNRTACHVQAHPAVDLHEARRREIEEVDVIRRDWLLQMSAQHADHEFQQQDNLTLGYVTTDQCGTKKPGDGDDVQHVPITVVDKWPRIVTWLSGVNETWVDLVFLDHGSSDVLCNLNNQSTTGRKYNESDIDKTFKAYTTNKVLGEYARTAWHQ